MVIPLRWATLRWRNNSLGVGDFFVFAAMIAVGAFAGGQILPLLKTVGRLADFGVIRFPMALRAGVVGHKIYFKD